MNLTNKLYLNCLVFITVDVLLLTAIFFGAMPSLGKSSFRCLKAQSDKEFVERELNQSGGIKDTYSRLEPDIKKADDLLIDREAPFTFFSFLEDLAEKHDLDINISPASDLKKYTDDNWDYIGLQLGLTGQSEKIWKFTEELENNRYLAAFQSINVLRFFDAQSKLSKVKSNILLKVYTKDKDENKE